MRNLMIPILAATLAATAARSRLDGHAMSEARGGPGF